MSELSPIYFEQDNNIPPNIAFMMGFLLAAHIFLNKLCSKYSDVYRYIEERKKKQFVAFWIEGFYKLIAVPFFLWFVIVAFDDSNDPTNLVSECQVITIFFEITVSMNSYQLLYCNYPDDLILHHVFTIGATLGALYNPDSYFYGSLMLTIDITFPFIPVINTLNIYGYKNSYICYFLRCVKLFIFAICRSIVVTIAAYKWISDYNWTINEYFIMSSGVSMVILYSSFIVYKETKILFFDQSNSLGDKRANKN